MKTADRIRKAATDAGWTIKARRGEEFQSIRGISRWEKDIFVIGSVDRNLADGTPVTEPEHSIEVYYTRSGAVWFAGGHTYTVPKVIYRDGVKSAPWERNRAARIIAALAAQTSDIPREV